MAQPHGMLFVATNISDKDEADFNQWYDYEHVEERVAIRGSLAEHVTSLLMLNVNIWDCMKLSLSKYLPAQIIMLRSLVKLSGQ